MKLDAIKTVGKINKNTVTNSKPQKNVCRENDVRERNNFSYPKNYYTKNLSFGGYGYNLSAVNLDNQIAGYESEKSIIKNIFIDQIAQEKAGVEQKVPGAIFIYGPIGTGKTVFAHAASSEAGCKLIQCNPAPEQFVDSVQRVLDESKDEYLSTGQRTVILIDNPELYLEDSPSNKLNIIYMQKQLDNCAKIPSEDIGNAYAATFFFTTNHPLDVTDEILLRDEKLGQLIALEPAEGENIKEVVKFYMKKCDPNKKIVDWDNYDYSNIIQTFNPNMKEGAYGNDRLKMMVQDAYEEYKENNGSDFEEILLRQSDKNSRNILPKRLKQYQDDLYMLCRKDYHTDDND